MCDEAHLNKEKTPKAKTIEDQLADPWRKLRQRPGVKVKDVARRER
jgi:hypothetical protein